MVFSKKTIESMVDLDSQGAYVLTAVSSTTTVRGRLVVK